MGACYNLVFRLADGCSQPVALSCLIHFPEGTLQPSARMLKESERATRSPVLSGCLSYLGTAGRASGTARRAAWKRLYVRGTACRSRRRAARSSRRLLGHCAGLFRAARGAGLGAVGREGAGSRGPIGELRGLGGARVPGGVRLTSAGPALPRLGGLLLSQVPGSAGTSYPGVPCLGAPELGEGRRERLRGLREGSLETPEGPFGALQLSPRGRNGSFLPARRRQQQQEEQDALLRAPPGGGELSAAPWPLPPSSSQKRTPLFLRPGEVSNLPESGGSPGSLRAVPAAEVQPNSGRPRPRLRASLRAPGGAHLPLARPRAASPAAPRPPLRSRSRLTRLRPAPRPRHGSRPMGGGSRGLAPPPPRQPRRRSLMAPRAGARGARGVRAAAGMGVGWPEVPGARTVTGRRHRPRRLTSAHGLTRTPPRPQVTRQGTAAGQESPAAHAVSDRSPRTKTPAESRRGSPKVSGPAGPHGQAHGPRTCRQEGRPSHLGLRVYAACGSGRALRREPFRTHLPCALGQCLARLHSPGLY
ncbi:basic salivary proline-rich protein 1-like [Choloepus didactylus]|uniref:basic salivary proline-rich protein 1-like n=1 Tax=Choloepus didactylus TaxID=27675 RepID=UPI00189FAF3E|nr:basic salivary proline-rich protein 1-like [Choloepus didactylus]